MSKHQLTVNRLLILIAIRCLQPCTISQLAEFLDRPPSTLANHLYGGLDGRILSTGLFDEGYATRAPYASKTIRLSEKGKEAIQDKCLVRENGQCTVWQVIKQFN